MQKEGQEGHLCARHKLDKHGHFITPSTTAQSPSSRSGNRGAESRSKLPKVAGLVKV